MYDYIYDMDICMYVETYYLIMKKISVELFYFLLDLSRMVAIFDSGV